ncbi:unnamed protein product [Knipowitschia caucasica]|uniref:Cytochrome b5 domain-containing protein 1 n=1 Tax=Knipowitschia caucasica TaxID=637954 RepID=A0AAV2KIU5_KNICA
MLWSARFSSSDPTVTGPAMKFFTPAEVSAHNTRDDLWVCVLGRVLDLTELAQKNKDEALLLPLLESAGKDISHWFDPETKDVCLFVDQVTQCRRYYTPRGRFVDVPPPGPRSDWACEHSTPWWRDQRYCIGLLSHKTRFIRVVNTLTGQEQRLEVCSEETLAAILDRYLPYNNHAHSYTWRHAGSDLDMGATLEENGIHDDDHLLHQLGLHDDALCPALLLHFTDDLS